MTGNWSVAWRSMTSTVTQDVMVSVRRIYDYSSGMVKDKCINRL